MKSGGPGHFCCWAALAVPLCLIPGGAGTSLPRHTAATPLVSGRPPLRSWSGKGKLTFCVRTAEAVATAEASVALVQPTGAGRGCAWHLRAALLGSGLLAALLQLLGAVLLPGTGCTLAPGWRSIQVQRPKCCRHHRAGLGATQRCGWPVRHGLPQGNVWLPHPLPCTLPSKALGGPGTVLGAAAGWCSVCRKPHRCSKPSRGPTRAKRCLPPLL